eukprot:9846570-Lingulodinium_polyedra.AAC.1
MALYVCPHQAGLHDPARAFVVLSGVVLCSRALHDRVQLHGTAPRRVNLYVAYSMMLHGTVRAALG